MIEVRCSKLDRVMNCAGFSHFKDLPEEEPGLPAQEGTAAGELLTAMIEQNTLKPTVGTHAANGVRFDEDMWFFVPMVAERIFETAQGNSVTSEQRIDWSALSDGSIMVRGQYDASYVVGTTLYVDDLKYGWGIVEAENNWQLLGYAIGILRRSMVKIDHVAMRIHQPRPNHENGWTREWKLTTAEVMAFRDMIGQRLFNIFNQGFGELRTGDHCKYCPALDRCPAFDGATANVIDYVLRNFDQNIMSDRTLAFQLRMFDRIEDIMKIKKDSLEQLAVSRINKGAVIPGYMIEPSYGDRKWKPFVTPEVLQILTGKNILQPEMLSPAKAEKIGVPKSLVAGITDRFFIKNKLKQKDAGKKADKIFGEPTLQIEATNGN